LTVEVTFGEEMGMNNAVMPNIIPNIALLPMRTFRVKNNNRAPTYTPNKAIYTRPFDERLKK
jgi:hypothetical protein